MSKLRNQKGLNIKTSQMVGQEVSPILQESSKEIGLYKQAIEQKRMEKERIVMTKEAITAQRNDCRNSCKATKIKCGKLDQQQQNALENYQRLQ